MEALVNPSQIRWARERAQLGLDELARDIKVSADKVVDWEEGRVRPSFAQAQKLAKATRIPFGFLFLDNPPQESLPLPDFRRMGTKWQNRISPDLRDVLNDVLYKQQWYRDYLVQKGAESLPFIGRFKGRSATSQFAASEIGKELGITETLRRSASNWEDYFGKLIKQAEAARIWVLRNSVVGNNNTRKLSEEEFRGFAIADDIAPLIFINTSDSKTAQIFTFAHELAHLWVGASGISNQSLESHSGDDEDVERYCNQIAAELLAPEKEFLSVWNQAVPDDERLTRTARYFRLSTVVIARRAFDLKIFGWNEYVITYRREKEKWVKSQRTDGQADFFNTLKSRNGNRFTRAVLLSAFEGQSLMRDAASLLGVKPNSLHAAYKKLLSGAKG
ncbi:ImmA/IrrE family metallo-endopeptidase [Burkholderia sp. Bp9143]|uniref:XRE family transcriptional regulator n=1 Tax=Burkholderia sp. Bp9143 TaxID=2184574 RepID=UPI000F5AC306|nr:XRE family transcriptional regulator [Burkholderia sp. Bp9143]RQR33873.1 ImmA/IrrE family metallo-endopeptidase [Burkholderia sp. Bp9143]